MREWWSKLLASLGGRRRLDDELREEIETHLEFEIQEHVGMGMTPEQARERVRRQFGNTTLIHENARETWTFRLLETTLQDARYGLRMLARSPGLAAAAFVSLALGIGANTGLFSVVNAVILRDLPVSHPEQLALLTWSSRAWPDKVVDDVEGDLDTDRATGVLKSASVSYDTWQYLSRTNRAFVASAAFSSNDERVNLGLGTGAQDAMLQAVSGDYFDTLGVPAIVGRTLEPADDRAGAPLAVVLSAGFWRRSFGGDESVAGRPMVINGQPATIVGVATPEFSGLDPGRSPDVYAPLTFEIDHYRRVFGSDLREPRVWWLTMVGRLKPGISEAEAAAELKVLFRQSVHIDSPAIDADAATPTLELSSGARGLNGLREQFSASLMLMMAMVALVLLIACANVAGLLLARATSRQHEISVRLSLGAPRHRIVRQLLTESLLLGALGGIAGLAVAEGVGTVLVTLFASAPRQPISLPLHLDARVFAFTAAISILSGVLFGLAPAVRAKRTTMYSPVRPSAGAAASGGHRFRPGKILVGAQVALSVLLLIGAGLLVRTLWHLQQVDLGFQREHLLLFDVQPGPNGYKGARLAAYYQDLERGIAAIPGVRSVGLSQRGPVGEGWSQGRVVIAGYTPSGKGMPFYRHWVSPGFFGTLGIPLVLGRLPGPRDVAASPRVVVVNQQFVRAYLHGDNPIGRTFDAGSLKAEIVGVVGDTKYGSLRDEPPPTAYFSYLQYTRDYPTSMTFEVRTADEPGSVVAAIRATADALDRNIPLVRVRTQSDVIRQSLFLERAFALLSGSFGLLALVLSCVGLYGTMSYMVSRRTSEIGIRMALGAPPEAIRRMVAREAALVVLAGIAAGMPAAWAATRLLKHQLFGVSPHDPGTIVIATSAIFLVTVVAGLLPAMRASRVDSAVALRCE